MCNRPDARAPLTGSVVHGAGRGRGLGFPTANIAADPGSPVPPPAIYSGWFVRRSTGGVHRGTISIGSNPTFCDTTDVHIEVYCHDAAGELYGERVVVWFVERIRDTVKFSSVDALVRAARQDVVRSDALLASDRGQRVLAEIRTALRPAASA
ncbi:MULTISPECIES: riboflavin kinase [unclassified Streptomyces]|uniref:riboflavin kinase n=1 Tax=unclassified Streptomyces TaxID=2593676 RepID=UPI000DAD0D15|nr:MULTISPECIES: riboflavin kinase [unclassified Streptomyces]PZT76656.1 hypothetical protein DNK56_25490 [Streptomyces sp. AC1-42W]PZT79388.1 hypothetical protein DNK55_07190 [Streptomyces sp. AC1-42T]